jgi:hypothetical protein
MSAPAGGVDRRACVAHRDIAFGGNISKGASLNPCPKGTSRRSHSTRPHAPFSECLRGPSVRHCRNCPALPCVYCRRGCAGDLLQESLVENLDHMLASVPMRYRNDRIRDALAAEYVLGTLRGPARRRFERSLKEAPRLRRAVAVWQNLLAPLNHSIEPVPPPARVWRHIRSRIAGSGRGRGPRLGFWASVGFWRAAAVASSAAALLLGGLDHPPACAGPAATDDGRGTLGRRVQTGAGRILGCGSPRSAAPAHPRDGSRGDGW